MSAARTEFAIGAEADIVMARRLVRQAAIDLGFGITDVTRIVTAASELVRNIYQYAGSGWMRIHPLDEGHRVGLELVFEDHGPGIANLEQAMTPGFTTSKGLGMGLPGARRLMDEMTVTSEPGRGTMVAVRKLLRK